MKTVKTKFHHQRASKMRSYLAAPLPLDANALWELDPHPDPDMLLFGLERSPKQENL